MGGMKKLMNRTLKPILIYALVVSVVSIPVYFLIIDFIWVRELDKHHYAIRRKIETRVNSLHLPDSTIWQTVAILNQTEPGFVLTAVGQTGDDRVYSIIRFDRFMQDREQFRCLVTYIRINGKPYRLLIETNMEEIDETILAIAAVTLFFFLVLLSGLIFLNRRMSLKLWQPFYAALQKLKQFNLQEEHRISFENTDTVEFKELNESLTKVLESNIAVYRQQKEFAENASHELQTPLAIVQSKLDVLLQSPDLTARQAEQIEVANRALSRVSRINKNLLLLAKLENLQFAEQEPVDLSTLLSDHIGLLSDYLEVKSLVVDSHIQPGIGVEGNRILIEILLTNLLLNAIRHTDVCGKIDVKLSANGLTVSNSGRVALHRENLFKRFSSGSFETPGSGLGLALVKEIGNRYGWKITYDFTAGQHVFRLTF
ncbi:HAMP domain-containing histidine kinase [Larkinella humicola]|uniref:histidine kinase n=2 Tax=Larkinella humicola TaxID=2607654 RepID=A0A5N1JLW5_9BACT|nr:HAMP domain-containing histidine kinase [Larkinella humicola]